MTATCAGCPRCSEARSSQVRFWTSGVLARRVEEHSPPLMRNDWTYVLTVVVTFWRNNVHRYRQRNPCSRLYGQTDYLINRGLHEFIAPNLPFIYYSFAELAPTYARGLARTRSGKGAKNPQPRKNFHSSSSPIEFLSTLHGNCDAAYCTSCLYIMSPYSPVETSW